MGCDSYYLEGASWPGIHFNESNDDLGCLCTFPHNDGETITAERVRSLAYLGAAVVLMQRGDIHSGMMPECLPQWMRDGIDALCGKGVEKLHTLVETQRDLLEHLQQQRDRQHASARRMMDMAVEWYIRDFCNGNELEVTVKETAK